jgi:hypothetical protein
MRWSSCISKCFGGNEDPKNNRFVDAKFQNVSEGTFVPKEECSQENRIRSQRNNFPRGSGDERQKKAQTGCEPRESHVQAARKEQTALKSQLNAQCARRRCKGRRQNTHQHLKVNQVTSPKLAPSGHLASTPAGPVLAIWGPWAKTSIEAPLYTERDL